jgi:hypothetical protein
VNQGLEDENLLEITEEEQKIWFKKSEKLRILRKILRYVPSNFYFFHQYG